MKFFSSLVAILLTSIITIWTSSNMNWGGDNYKCLISSDGCGYYAYLPAIFIYKDLQFSHFDKVEMSKEYFSTFTTQDYRLKTENGTIDKYYVGSAILWMPFFGIAHLVASNFGHLTDGYSYPYQVSINIASIFYLCLGIWLLSKLLIQFGFDQKSVFWSIILTVFGTNIFYYAVLIPSFSHILSFCSIIAFFYFINQYKATKLLIDLILGSIILGIVFLIRPVNIIILLFVPFLFADIKELIFRLRQISLKHYLISFLCTLLVVSIQFLIYKLQTGSWIVYSYNKETFDFLNPQLVDYLISYRKGFFVYTPMFSLFFLVGLYSLFKENPFKGSVLFTTFLFFCYVASSWWCWWYGSSFSQRPMIDIMFLLSILICYALKNQTKGFQNTLIGIGILLLVFNQFQIYQLRYGVILQDGMTSELYWDAFLNVNKLLDATK
ncbi:MAG: hypothetical protein H7329_09380 [Opitutaceae bacterium]|nr:hypothetical protein [Cytophagales bacterium]